MMKPLGHIAALLTTAAYFAVPVAAEPDLSAPTELEFRKQCEPVEIQARGPGVILPRLTAESPISAPPYPAASRKRGEHGTVVMQLLVNEEGRVTRAKLAKSSGYPTLDLIALKETRKWKLAPGTIDGKAQCMWTPFSTTWAATLAH